MNGKYTHLDTLKSMIIITKYTLKVNENGQKCVISGENIPCPCCGGCLTLKDFRLRKIHWPNGDIEFILIRVLYCAHCNKSHRELPDCLLPYKHYASKVIEVAIDGDTINCAVEDSTIYRWREWFCRAAAYINAVLTACWAAFEKIPLSALNPLELMKKSGSGWLCGIMRRYVNFGGSLSEIT